MFPWLIWFMLGAEPVEAPPEIEEEIVAAKESGRDADGAFRVGDRLYRYDYSGTLHEEVLVQVGWVRPMIPVDAE